MQEYEKPKKPTYRVFAPWFVLILLILLIFCAQGVWNIFQKHAESKRNLARVELEMQELKDRKDILEKEVNDLQTDEGLESEVRSRFQVSKEGEKVIIFNEQDQSDSAIGDTDETGEKSLWQKFKEAIGL